MADPNDISQLFAEALAEAGSDQLSQLIAEALATTGNDQLSQLIVQALATTGPDQISQLTIELLRGPEVVPPADNPVGMFSFDEGLGNSYYLALWPSDSGDELRSKTVKPFHVTGLGSNRIGKVYSYDVNESINVSAVEAGTGYKALQVVPDSPNHVQQSPRLSVNVPNSNVHLLRVEGMWSGVGPRDRLDQMVYEVAKQGVRR